ncbi:MAG: acyl carrier protein [Chloroflexi bacterium]|nr:acyl carrier protein [Chloroflexota bacterium]
MSQAITNTSEVDADKEAEVRATVREFVLENYIAASGGAELSDSASLLDEQIMDSTGVMELSLFIGETFGFRVRGADLTPENFDSIDAVVQYVVSHLPK